MRASVGHSSRFADYPESESAGCLTTHDARIRPAFDADITAERVTRANESVRLRTTAWVSM
jgi:hypothetical protein